ncbi:DEAD/DEAH box helicase [Microlunatus spumicola]|uniref:DEAD/DEAH box helicase n=1 Tax=Microlunatus spumicola TaxID=81499 RepID=A0ABP6XIS8_9ACTN
MEQGLYEQLLTQGFRSQLAQEVGLEQLVSGVDEGDQPHVLARHVESVLQRALAATADPERRLTLVNDVLAVLSATTDTVVHPPQQLLSMRTPPGPGVLTYESVRPSTPLAEAALLTNTRGEPNLGSELKAELDTADEVDLLCAFVKWYGLRLLEPELARRRDRGAPFRVITTTYMGATDPDALDRLVREFGADVKIQYDAQRTRLHAKAWMFRRRTLFDTAYVGSSNLSRAALLEGVEWNVRLSRVGTPALLEKFRATFDTYWNDPSFERYNPDEDRDRLDDALAEASGRTTSGRVTLSLSGLEVRPYPHQQAMLDALDVERHVHDRHRNLLVAATGTGKTVIAALDYRALTAAASERPSLLFVAHRREILEQSLRTYREVLNDPDFGELYVGGARPERWRHVFASVQSLTAYGVANFAPDAYDVVVIDEFHHAEASTYRRLLDRLQPQELLGLTATPERTDGLDVRSFFGGRTAAELRLWDALGADLLCPFHYFAISDGTDLRRVAWSRGRYDEAELTGLYTGNRARAALVLQQLQDKVLNLAGIRALGFCVSVAHAQFMAEVFRAAGVAAVAVSGTTPPAERAQALADLRDRRVNAIFVADLFNEGVDLPDVDTVLFLRPTESATLFLQQLGRGLRRTRDKAVLTVLDFVGHHRKEFRFDHRLRALTGETRRGLVRAVERGFPFLPSGCQIVMDRQSQQLVLENIRSQVGNRWPQMVAELRAYGDQDLPTFLQESGLELSDVLRNNHSWTELRQAAGLPTRAGADREAALLKRGRALAHVDDPSRVEAYRRLLHDDAPGYRDLSLAERRLADMLFFSLWPGGGDHRSIEVGLEQLRTEAAVRDELQAVVDLAFDSAPHVTFGLEGQLRDVPLRVHARYQREEVLAALGYASFQRKPNSFREGVLYVPERDVDAFFVTLQKSEADYSPTTLYQDYPISPTLFHWESQSTTSVASRTGQRYLSGSSTKLLFVRQHKSDEFGTSPYLFAGPVRYVQHRGERPVAITWQLEHPLPNDFFIEASVAAG